MSIAMPLSLAEYSSTKYTQTATRELLNEPRARKESIRRLLFPDKKRFAKKYSREYSLFTLEEKLRLPNHSEKF